VKKSALYRLEMLDEYRARNNSLSRGGEKVHDSRNRGERALMHRGHGNAIDDLLFYNLARDSGRRRVTHFDDFDDFISHTHFRLQIADYLNHG